MNAGNGACGMLSLAIMRTAALAGSRRSARFAVTALCVAVTLASAGTVSAQPSTPNANRFAIRNVTIVDVENGQHLAGQTVVVTRNRITAVGPSERVSTSRMRIIDGSGRFLIPGIWEMHAHALQHYGVDYAYGMEAFQLFVANGITGIRDAGSSMDQVVAGRKRIAETGVAAPRIFAAGPILEGNAESRFAPFTKVVSTPAAGRLTVSALRDAGVDWIKIQVAASPDYLARLGTPSHPMELSIHRCVGLSGGTRGRTRWQFRTPRERLLVPVNLCVVSDTNLALIFAARAGMGFVYAPRAVISQELESGLLQPVLTEFCTGIAWGIHAIYPGRNPTANARILVEFIRSSLPTLDSIDRWQPEPCPPIKTGTVRG